MKKQRVYFNSSNSESTLFLFGLKFGFYHGHVDVYMDLCMYVYA